MKGMFGWLKNWNIGSLCISGFLIVTISSTRRVTTSAVNMLARIPMGRFGNGRDVAAIVLFLLSELGSYVTGQVINCDGGMVMQ